MKTFFLTSSVALMLAIHPAPSAPGAAEAEQIKLDLVGHTMGGREKCWKFQSPDHIKELVIQERTEDAQKRAYVLKLQLEADKACGRYLAIVRVEYAKSNAGWKVKQVGLVSLTKME